MLAILVSLLLTLPSLSADGVTKARALHYSLRKIFVWALFRPSRLRCCTHSGGDTRGCYLLVAAVQLQPAVDPAVDHPWVALTRNRSTAYRRENQPAAGGVMLSALCRMKLDVPFF